MPAEDNILSPAALNPEACTQYIQANSGIPGPNDLPGCTHSSLPDRCWVAHGRMMALPLFSVTLDKLPNQGPQCPKLVGRAPRRQRIPHLLKGKHTSADPGPKRRVLLKSRLATALEVNGHLK